MAITNAKVLRTVLRLSCCSVGFGLSLLGIYMPWVLVITGLGLAWRQSRRVASSGWTHGTARLASLKELIRYSMLGQDGLILGTTDLMPRPSLKDGIAALWRASLTPELACYLFLHALGGWRWAGDRMIRITKFTHLITCAPTGRGKGIGVLIPNLRSYPHSCVVTDPKGELFMETAAIRHHKLKNRVIKLDPFDVCGYGSDRLNPLDFIDDSAPDFLDQCRDLADMMIMQTGKEPDPYWNDSARGVLTAFIAYVCACETNPEARTLDLVRDLVSSRHSYTESIGVMQRTESHNGIIKRLGHSLTWHVDRELGSVLSNVQRHTEAFDSPLIAQNMTSSTFDPRCLRSGRVTIYLILPHDKLETLSPLMRVWIGVILRVITRGKPSEKNPVLFLLDEAAHLGKIRVLEQAVTLMRGMGIRLWFFFQSLHQLQDCFGDKAKTVLDNIDTQQHFAINDPDNAEAISKRIGDTTISITTFGENQGWTENTGGTGPPSGSTSGGQNVSVTNNGRRLFKSEELIVLPEEVALVFHRNLPVIPVRLVKYFEHPSFRNNGTGQEPGLSRSATEKAVCLLVACLAFAALVASLTLSPSEPFGPINYRPRMARPGFVRRVSRGGGTHAVPSPVTNLGDFE